MNELIPVNPRTLTAAQYSDLADVPAEMAIIAQPLEKVKLAASTVLNHPPPLPA